MKERAQIRLICASPQGIDQGFEGSGRPQIRLIFTPPEVLKPWSKQCKRVKKLEIQN